MKELKTLLLVFALLVVWTVADVDAQTIKDRFAGIYIEHDADIDGDLDVDGTANLDVTDIDGAVDMASTLGVTGDVTAAADVTIDDTLNIDDTANALTGTQTITPTYSYLQVAPVASVLTMTIATGAASDGDIFIVHNTVTTNTVIVDTGATAGGGNVTVGLNDIAVFIFGNSKWIEIASPDNS